MSLLTRADVRSGCWRIWGSARTRASPATSVRSGEQGQQEADAKARRSRRCGGKTTGRSRCSASARDDRDTCGCVACQRGCAFVAGGPLPLALPCRMGSILGSAPPPQQPLADTSAACRRQQMQRARQDAFSSANRRALAAALPPLVDSVSSAHRSVMEALGLARRGGVSCPPGVHSDFASPQSDQPAEQLTTTIRQLAARGAHSRRDGFALQAIHRWGCSSNGRALA